MASVPITAPNPEEEKARAQVENNKLEAIKLAERIFTIVKNKEFVEKTDEQQRFRILTQKYPNFSNAYPIILRYMAMNLRYNSTAFRRFLDRLETNPGKGMEGFIDCQALYAKYLYIEECKENGLHWDNKKANEIYKAEFKGMNDYVKKIKQQEKEAKNEYAEESERHLEEKRRELLDFLDTEAPTVEEEPQPASATADSTPQKRPATIYDIDYSTFSYEQLCQLHRDLAEHEITLMDLLEQANEHIHNLEEAKWLEEERLRRKQLSPEEMEWLRGTCLDKLVKKQSSSTQPTKKHKKKNKK